MPVSQRFELAEKRQACHYLPKPGQSIYIPVHIYTHIHSRMPACACTSCVLLFCFVFFAFVFLFHLSLSSRAAKITRLLDIYTLRTRFSTIDCRRRNSSSERASACLPFACTSRFPIEFPRRAVMICFYADGFAKCRLGGVLRETI